MHLYIFSIICFIANANANTIVAFEDDTVIFECKGDKYTYINWEFEYNTIIPTKLYNTNMTPMCKVNCDKNPEYQQIRVPYAKNGPDVIYIKRVNNTYILMIKATLKARGDYKCIRDYNLNDVVKFSLVVKPLLNITKEFNGLCIILNITFEINGLCTILLHKEVDDPQIYLIEKNSVSSNKTIAFITYSHNNVIKACSHFKPIIINDVIFQFEVCFNNDSSKIFYSDEYVFNQKQLITLSSLYNTQKILAFIILIPIEIIIFLLLLFCCRDTTIWIQIRSWKYELNVRSYCCIRWNTSTRRPTTSYACKVKTKKYKASDESVEMNDLPTPIV